MQRQCQRLRFVSSDNQHLPLSEVSSKLRAAANTGACQQWLRQQQHSAAPLRISVQRHAASASHQLSDNDRTSATAPAFFQQLQSVCHGSHSIFKRQRQRKRCAAATSAYSLASQRDRLCCMQQHRRIKLRLDRQQQSAPALFGFSGSAASVISLCSSNSYFVFSVVISAPQFNSNGAACVICSGGFLSFSISNRLHRYAAAATSDLRQQQHSISIQRP
jgi:hypothetical protein